MNTPPRQAPPLPDPPTLDTESLDPNDDALVGAAPAERAGPDHRLHAPASPRPASSHLTSGRLAGLTLSAAIWTLAWPILCESVLNSTVGLVDTILADNISKSATDGVGAGAYILWFVGLVAMAISVGATALISRSIGAGRMATANAALGQSVMLAGVAGLLAGIAQYVVAPYLTGIFSLTPEAAQDFVLYMRALAPGTPLTTIMLAAIACSQGAGDTLRPMMVMVVVNLVNLACAWALAYKLHMGTFGIGLGTTIARAVGTTLILLVHVYGLAGIRLRARRLRPHATTAFRLVRLGLPNFMETFGMWVGNMLVVIMVGRLALAAGEAVGVSGDETTGMLGAHLLAIRIEAFSFLPGFAMGIAAGALCGQYLGAKQPALARRSALICVALAATLMGTCGVVFVTLGKVLVRLASPQPEHIELVPKLLAITGLVQIPFAIAIVFRSSMHGAGDVKAVMKMTWASTWGARLPLAYAISGVDLPVPTWLSADGILHNPFPFHAGLPGLWIGLAIEIVLRCSIYTARFIHGGWTRARV